MLRSIVVVDIIRLSSGTYSTNGFALYASLDGVTSLPCGYAGTLSK